MALNDSSEELQGVLNVTLEDKEFLTLYDRESAYFWKDKAELSEAF